MEEQRQRVGGQRKRRRNNKNKNKNDAKSKAAPVLIAARRPDSPLLSKVGNRSIAASAQPKKPRGSSVREAEEPKNATQGAEKPRRVARIALAQSASLDDDELRRERLLDRLVACEGRSAISRIANEFWSNDIPVPEEQEVQLQLLEHVDERRARDAIDAMSRLLRAEAPIKRPILDQRLRRLEDEADEAETREKAGELRRWLRGAA